MNLESQRARRRLWPIRSLQHEIIIRILMKVYCRESFRARYILFDCADEKCFESGFVSRIVSGTSRYERKAR